MEKPYKFGIISALKEEQAGMQDEMLLTKIERLGKRDYICGNLWGHECICVLSGIGKVAAASAATMLIERFKVTHILLTGVAGGASSEIRVGDVVVAQELIQHDMDASPLFPRFEIPLTGLSRFKSDSSLTQNVLKACFHFIDQDFPTAIETTEQTAFSMTHPKIHHGLIGSGDLFVNCANKMEVLKEALPDLLAVEMEGAAVAQVCHEFGIPFATIRTISDNANEYSAIDFTRFIQRIASVYALHIVRRICNAYTQ